MRRYNEETGRNLNRTALLIMIMMEYAEEHYHGAIEEVESSHRNNPDIVEDRNYLYSLMVEEYGYNIEDHPEEERKLFSELKDEFGKL